MSNFPIMKSKMLTSKCFLKDLNCTSTSINNTTRDVTTKEYLRS